MAPGAARLPRRPPTVGDVVAMVVVAVVVLAVSEFTLASSTASRSAGRTAAGRTGTTDPSLTSPVPPAPTVTAVPPGSALVATSAGWRALADPPTLAPRRTPDPALTARLGVTVIDAVIGDVDQDGDDEVVVVFVRPARRTLAGATLATPVPSDAQGRTLHLGVYDDAMHQVWVAGTVLRPIAAVAVCGGSVVLAYSSSPGATDRVGVGVVRWSGYGFTTSPDLPDLPGDGVPACAEVGRDHLLEPVVLGRSTA